MVSTSLSLASLSASASSRGLGERCRGRGFSRVLAFKSRGARVCEEPARTGELRLWLGTGVETEEGAGDGECPARARLRKWR